MYGLIRKVMYLPFFFKELADVVLWIDCKGAGEQRPQ